MCGFNSRYLEGNLGIGAHGRSNLCNLICLKHLIWSNVFFLHKSSIFRHACASCSELPSNINTLTDSAHTEEFMTFMTLHTRMIQARTRVFLSGGGRNLNKYQNWAPSHSLHIQYVYLNSYVAFMRSNLISLLFFFSNFGLTQTYCNDML